MSRDLVGIAICKKINSLSGKTQRIMWRFYTVGRFGYLTGFTGLAGSLLISHPGGIESESAFHRAGRAHRGRREKHFFVCRETPEE